MNKVSVIIPVYNPQSKLVQDAIDSCLFQTGPVEMEIILVDDGTDLPIKWYNEVDRSDERIKFFQLGTNQGVAVAWDFGIQQATGDWICPMACDDFFHPDKTEVQLTYMKHTKAQFSYSGYRELFFDPSYVLQGVKMHDVANVPDNDGKEIWKKLVEQDFGNNFINGAAVIMSKEVYNSVAGYDKRLRYKQDYDLWLQIADKHKVLGVPLPLMSRRIHSNQAKKFFANDKVLNERYRRSIEYAIIKLKWMDELQPILHPAVDKKVLREEGYID